MDGLIWFLLIGLAAGWLAGQLMKKRSMGLIGDIEAFLIGISPATFPTANDVWGGTFISDRFVADIRKIMRLPLPPQT
ncbi:GlsB/YeaQ/YmgE family stress response membrane protein [bacterium]|nr:GlsB/YeaQ/YmgE family stress response membrane protein [bacterium]